MWDRAIWLQVESGKRRRVVTAATRMLRMREAMRWTIPSLPLVALGGFWQNDRMKVPMSLLIGAVCCGLLAVTSPAAAQAPVEIRATAPGKPRQIHIVEPSPATRDATRPREADFYGEDVRVAR